MLFTQVMKMECLDLIFNDMIIRVFEIHIKIKLIFSHIFVFTHFGGNGISNMIMIQGT